MDFDAALLAAQNGKSDIVMAGVTVTDERQKVMDFSDTYAEGIQSIIVPEDSDIASADDLTGKAIGTQRALPVTFTAPTTSVRTTSSPMMTV